MVLLQIAYWATRALITALFPCTTALVVAKKPAQRESGLAQVLLPSMTALQPIWTPLLRPRVCGPIVMQVLPLCSTTSSAHTCAFARKAHGAHRRSNALTENALWQTSSISSAHCAQKGSFKLRKTTELAHCARQECFNQARDPPAAHTAPFPLTSKEKDSVRATIVLQDQSLGLMLVHVHVQCAMQGSTQQSPVQVLLVVLIVQVGASLNTLGRPAVADAKQGGTRDPRAKRTAKYASWVQ